MALLVLVEFGNRPLSRSRVDRMVGETSMNPIENFLAKLDGVTKHGDYYTARCPGHEDRMASLSIREGANGKVLVKCHAGCTAETIINSLGVDWSNMFADEKDASREIEKIYDYVDANNKLIHQQIRYWPKGFASRQPEGGDWVWNLKGVERVLYHLPDLLSSPEELVYIVEGEKDADNLKELGVLATTNIGGAGKWRPEYNEFLKNRSVAILPDNDAPGYAHAQDVASQLKGVASSVVIVKLPGLPEKGDVSDWIKSGGTIQKLSALVEEATEMGKPGIRYFNLEKEPGDMEWLVNGWLAKRDVALLAGRAGAGKSTTAAELAIALAGGRNGEGFLGIHIENPVPVMYLDEEAGEDDVRRLFWRLGAGGNILPDLHVASCQGLRLDKDESIERIEYDIKTKQPGLVILDTASHFFGDADENNASDVAKMFKPLFKLREQYAATFLIVHHLRKAPSSYGNGNASSDDLLDRVRGSSSFTTQASTVWTASQSPDGGYVDLAIQKRRGGRKTSMRIQYAESNGRITLTSMGEPERVESALDRASRFIVSSMEADARETWTTPQIINHAGKNGHGERNTKLAISHLHGIGALSRVKAGVYYLSRMKTIQNGVLDV